MNSSDVAKEYLRAVTENRVEGVRALLARNPQIDVNTGWPLHTAVQSGSLEMVDALIAAGVGLNQFRQFYEDTPLIVAVTRQSLPMAERLLKAGADPNMCDTGTKKAPPLLHTLSEDMASLLLFHGADANGSDSQGKTPLLHFTQSVAVCKMLVRAEADLERRDCLGYTALSLAVERSDLHMVKYLLEAGARRDILTPTGRPLLDIATDKLVFSALQNHAMPALSSQQRRQSRSVFGFLHWRKDPRAPATASPILTEAQTLSSASPKQQRVQSTASTQSTPAESSADSSTLSTASTTYKGRQSSATSHASPMDQASSSTSAAVDTGRESALEVRVAALEKICREQQRELQSLHEVVALLQKQLRAMDIYADSQSK